MAEPISIQQLKDASLDVKSLEEVVNGDENVVVTTRLGETYPSIKSVLEDTISRLGFVTVDSFELGATITQRNQALRHAVDGKLYRWAGDLPKAVAANSTPTGSGGFGANAWIEVSDASLRQELTDPNIGAALVARNVMSVGSIAELLSLPESMRKSDMQYLVKGYHSGSDVGGGCFYWDSNKAKSQHNGGIVISPSVPWSGNFTSIEGFLTKVGETNPTGEGCFIRVTNNDNKTKFNALNWGGLVGSSTTDVKALNATVISHLLSLNESTVFFVAGDWYTNPVTKFKKVMTFLGESHDIFSDRKNLTKIHTEGGDFCNVPTAAGLNSVLFIAKNISFISTDQSGDCFTTEDSNETGFSFNTVLIERFHKAFYAPKYSSTSDGYNVSFSRNYYGCWSILASNGTILTNVRFDFNAFGCKIYGNNTEISGVHLGCGYTGTDASTTPSFIGFDARGGTIRNVYVEAYGSDAEKVVMLRAAPSDNHTFLYNFSFPNSGDTADAKHIEVYRVNDILNPVYPEEWLHIDAALTIPTVYATAGETKLVRGITLNGDAGLKKNRSGTSAYFARYDLSVKLLKEDIKTTRTIGSDGQNIQAITYDRTKITDLDLIINNEDTSNSVTTVYDSSQRALRPLGFGRFEATIKLFSNSFSGTGPFHVAIRYRDRTATYRVAVLGIAQTYGTTVGSITLNFNETIIFDALGDTAFHVGFLSDSGATAPTAEDIDTLSLELRLRKL